MGAREITRKSKMWTRIADLARGRVERGALADRRAWPNVVLQYSTTGSEGFIMSELCTSLKDINRSVSVLQRAPQGLW